MDESIIAQLFALKTNLGMILETYGSGALPKNMVPLIEKHIKQGFPIFLTSSCAESGVSYHMEEHDEDAIEARKVGVRTARDMSTAAATVKLMNIMALVDKNTDCITRLTEINHEMLGKNYAEEITLE